MNQKYYILHEFPFDLFCIENERLKIYTYRKGTICHGIQYAVFKGDDGFMYYITKNQLQFLHKDFIYQKKNGKSVTFSVLERKEYEINNDKQTILKLSNASDVIFIIGNDTVKFYRLLKGYVAYKDNNRLYRLTLENGEGINILENRILFAIQKGSSLEDAKYRNSNYTILEDEEIIKMFMVKDEVRRVCNVSFFETLWDDVTNLAIENKVIKKQGEDIKSLLIRLIKDRIRIHISYRYKLKSFSFDSYDEIFNKYGKEITI